MVAVTMENSCSLRDESLLLFAFISSSLARDGRGMLRDGGEEREEEGNKWNWSGEDGILLTEVLEVVENKP